MVVFIADGKMMAANAAFLKPGFKFSIKPEGRLTKCSMSDGNAAQMQWMTQPGAGSLGKRLLGGKALGQETRWVR